MVVSPHQLVSRISSINSIKFAKTRYFTLTINKLPGICGKLSAMVFLLGNVSYHGYIHRDSFCRSAQGHWLRAAKT